MMQYLGPNCRFGLPIREIGPQHLTTDDGITHEGALVVDGRGLGGDSLGADPRSLDGPKTCGYQKFTGLTLETPTPHGITYPIVMDARVDQTEGFRFVYVLPWSAHQVLVEDTYYSENPRFDPKVLGDRAQHYAANILGISSPFGVVHLESGILPIPLGSFKRPTSVILASGMRAGLFHPTTSYSLGAAVSFAEFFATHWRFDQKSTFIQKASCYQETHWQQGSFFRRLNNMLFLAAAPSKRVKIFEQFYKRPQSLIQRFYRGQLAPFDKVSLLFGVPPIPVGPALRAFMNPSPREVYDVRL
jgi:lycopene beta-cyclase